MTEKNFEESLVRLEEIVKQLDDGRTDLETALSRYEEGVGLLKHCHGILEKTQRKIEILRNIQADGSVEVENIDEKQFKTELNSKRKSV